MTEKEKEYVIEDIIETPKDDVNDKKESDNRLPNVLSLPWKDVSHVLIGPNGITLIPPSAKEKYPYPSRSKEYPTPGSDNSIMTFDLDGLIGAFARIEDLEKEIAIKTKELNDLKEKINAQAQTKQPEQKDNTAITNPQEKEEEQEKNNSTSPEKDKETEIKKEKDNAMTKDEQDNKKNADHESSEPGLRDLMLGLKLAKERNLI